MLLILFTEVLVLGLVWYFFVCLAYLSVALPCSLKEVIEGPDHDAGVVPGPHHGVRLAAACGPVREHRGVVSVHDVVHQVLGGGGVDLLLARVRAKHHVKHILPLVVTPLPQVVNLFGLG